MSQAWLPTAPDQRTFGDLQARTADDLNRPDLVSVIQQYLQDAIRYHQRKPFFFNETDNTTPILTWAAGTYYTQGATLMASSPSPTPIPAPPPTVWAANTTYAVGDFVLDSNGNLEQAVLAGTSGATAPDWETAGFNQTQDNTVVWLLVNLPAAGPLTVVNLVAGVSGTTPPAFTQTVYTPPTGMSSPPVFTFAPGMTTDGATVLWASASAWQPAIYTQLSTVPFQNQYVPPLDFIAPKRIEVTWSGNLRIGMTKLTYDELRDYDVIRPTPPTTYPTWWAWYQQQLYFWPYPVGFYPVTLSYRTAPALPVATTDSNFWTTQAEGLIRHFACGRILEGVVHDPEAAQEHYDLAKQELSALLSQRIQQDTAGEGDGIPATVW